MFRVFAILGIFSLLLIATSGLGIVWFASSAINQAKLSQIGALAQGKASTISAQIELFNKSLDKLAEDERAVQAILGGDHETLRQTASKLSLLVPYGLNLRLLLPGTTELDDKVQPPMTYADLEMVRETFATERNPPPAIHGDDPIHKHLAIARKITQNKQTVGVILASIDREFILKQLSQLKLEDGYLELKQAKLILGKSGRADAADIDLSHEIPIPGTSWIIVYGAVESVLSWNTGIMLGFLLIPMVLSAFGTLFGYRRLAKQLSEDLISTMRAFKDLMKNNFQGNYFTQLNEMKGFISTLSQYKRVLEHDILGSDLPASSPADDDALNLSNVPNNLIDLSKAVPGALNKSGVKAKAPPVSNEVFKKPQQAAIAKAPAAATANSTGGSEKLNKQSSENPKITPEPVADPIASTFRASDIRGIVGSVLTKELAYDIGRSLGTEAKDLSCETIVIAHDGRSSSPGIADAVANGLLSTGCNLIDIGKVPTPVLYFVAHHIESQSGIMVTGGHSGSQYNGVKMIFKDKTLSKERIQNLKKRIDDKAFHVGQSGKIEKFDRYVTEYIGTVSEDVHLHRPMKVVVDCGNGVAGTIVPKLLKTIGCEVIELYCDIDGNFPNHYPDPRQPANLQELILAVNHYEADLGLAFDCDGDSLGVVDSNGRIIWPDRLMMLFAQNVLSARPGAEILFDVKCCRNLANFIKKHGGRPTLCKSGHSFVKSKLLECGAALAGEMSGHIYFNDRWFGFDDALYSASRLIEILSEDSRASAEVFDTLPDSTSTPEIDIPLKEGESVLLVKKILQEAKFPNAKINTLDGFRVDFPDGFGVVRASNSSPSLNMRYEADNATALTRIQHEFGELLRKIKPDISLTL